MLDEQTLAAASSDPALEGADTVRHAVVAALTGEAVLDAVRHLAQGGAALPLRGCLPHPARKAILADLRADQGWQHHYWVLDANEAVSRVSMETFATTPARLRFSTNPCLRRPAESAASLRAFLAALRDPTVEAAL